jgi:hypothetical protein
VSSRSRAKVGSRWKRIRKGKQERVAADPP